MNINRWSKQYENTNFNHELTQTSDIDMFVTCSWVDTRWQQYNTHLHTHNTQNDTINGFGWKAFLEFEPGVVKLKFMTNWVKIVS